MRSSRRYRGWRNAPLRFAVWLVAAIYLGRIAYNNSLHDVRTLNAKYVVVRTISISIVLAFVYWNLFIMDPFLAAYIWTAVLFLLGAVIFYRSMIEAGVSYTESNDPLERRKYAQRLDDESITDSISTRRTGDTGDD